MPWHILSFVEAFSLFYMKSFSFPVKQKKNFLIPVFNVFLFFSSSPVHRYNLDRLLLKGKREKRETFAMTSSIIQHDMTSFFIPTEKNMKMSLKYSFMTFACFGGEREREKEQKRRKIMSKIVVSHY